MRYTGEKPASFVKRGFSNQSIAPSRNHERLRKPLAVFVVGRNYTPPILYFLQIHGNLCCLFAFSNDVKGKHGILFAADGRHFYREPRIAFVHLSDLSLDDLILADERL